MTRAPVERAYGGISAADRRADRRARLLQAGRLLWGRGGQTAVTVRGVCAQAGLTPRYFYEHFSDRHVLLCAIHDQVVAQVVEVLVDAGDDRGSVLGARLHAAITAMLELIAADPHIHRILAAEPEPGTGLATRRTALVDAVTDVVVASAPEVVRGPLPDPAQLRRRAQFIVGGVDAVIGDWLGDPVDAPTEVAAQCAQLAVAVVAGLA